MCAYACARAWLAHASWQSTAFNRASVNGLSISMAGLFDGGGPAVRVYEGSVAGTELIGADSSIYQAGPSAAAASFVVDAQVSAPLLV